MPASAPFLKKRVPSYWWDLDTRANNILVESDDDRVPLVATYPFDPILGAEAAIALAIVHIEDLKAGRRSAR